MAAIKAGLRLRSVVSDTEVVVVKAPSVDVELTCGGSPLVAVGDPQPPAGEFTGDGEALLGKRYIDEELGFELLCTRAGKGELAVDGRPLVIKGAKALPSSD